MRHARFWAGLAVLMLVSGFCLGQEAPPEETPPPAGKETDQKPSLEEKEKPTPKKPEGAGLETIIVSASRCRQRVLEAPQAMEVLSEKKLQEVPYHTLPEALREIPGVNVQKTSSGQGSPYIRGFTGFRNLLLIDGVRLNNSIFREGPNQYWRHVDLYTARRVEVLKGPAAVLWGSDAVGGTLNVITNERTDFAPGTHVNGRQLVRYASADRSWIGRSEMQGNFNDLGWFFGFTPKYFDDLTGGRRVGLQPYTGYEEYHYDGKLQYRLTDDSQLVLAYQHAAQENVPRTHKTVYGISFDDTTIGTDAKHQFDHQRDLVYLQYHGRNFESKLLDEAHASVSYHRQDEERFRQHTDGREDFQGVTVETTGAWVQLVTKGDFGRFTYGGEWYHDAVDSFNEKYQADGTLEKVEVQGPVGDRASYDLFGVFLQWDREIVQKLELYLGLRFTGAHAHAGEVADLVTSGEMSISDHWTDFGWSARFVYCLTDEVHLFGGASTAFRAPNLSDLTRYGDARTGTVEVPTTGLDPERFLQYELGGKVSREGLWLQVAGYYLTIDGMINRFTTGKLIEGNQELAKQNGSDGFAVGLELAGGWEFTPQWTLSAWVAGTYGEAKTPIGLDPTNETITSIEPLSRLVPWMGGAALRWEAPDRRYFAEASLLWQGTADNLSALDELDTSRIPPEGTRGWAVVNLRAGMSFLKGLRGAVGVENLLDHDYRCHGSGSNEPGTNVVLTLDWHF